MLALPKLIYQRTTQPKTPAKCHTVSRVTATMLVHHLEDGAAAKVGKGQLCLRE